MEPSVYQYPSIFRRVHMEKPGEIEEETEFLKKVWRRHLKKPVRRVLDIASGDSPHGQILAREGIRVVGIDRSPTMISSHIFIRSDACCAAAGFTVSILTRWIASGWCASASDGNGAKSAPPT